MRRDGPVVDVAVLDLSRIFVILDQRALYAFDRSEADMQAATVRDTRVTLFECGTWEERLLIDDLKLAEAASAVKVISRVKMFLSSSWRYFGSAGKLRSKANASSDMCVSGEADPIEGALHSLKNSSEPFVSWSRTARI